MFFHRGFTNGFFFVCTFHTQSYSARQQWAASGAARKETATRYATVDLMMMSALVEVQWSTKGVALLAAES